MRKRKREKEKKIDDEVEWVSVSFADGSSFRRAYKTGTIKRAQVPRK